MEFMQAVAGTVLEVGFETDTRRLSVGREREAAERADEQKRKAGLVARKEALQAVLRAQLAEKAAAKARRGEEQRTELAGIQLTIQVRPRDARVPAPQIHMHGAGASTHEGVLTPQERSNVLLCRRTGPWTGRTGSGTAPSASSSRAALMHRWRPTLRGTRQHLGPCPRQSGRSIQSCCSRHDLGHVRISTCVEGTFDKLQ